VLDVGSGSGFLSAAFYELVKTEEKKTVVVGIDHIEGLVQWSVDNLNKSYSDQLKSGEIKMVCGDGRLGYPEEAPYDVIHVGAAAP
jgi:protein-L-isoaspartate(D-aspartate) O-methyltransferase